MPFPHNLQASKTHRTILFSPAVLGRDLAPISWPSPGQILTCNLPCKTKPRGALLHSPTLSHLTCAKCGIWLRKAKTHRNPRHVSQNKETFSISTHPSRQRSKHCSIACMACRVGLSGRRWNQFHRSLKNRRFKNSKVSSCYSRHPPLRNLVPLRFG